MNMRMHTRQWFRVSCVDVYTFCEGNELPTHRTTRPLLRMALQSNEIDECQETVVGPARHHSVSNECKSNESQAKRHSTLVSYHIVHQQRCVQPCCHHASI